jgi:hypothetical protein
MWSARQYDEQRVHVNVLSLILLHTGHTIIMDDGSAKDSTHYTAAQLREVRWSATGEQIQCPHGK